MTHVADTLGEVVRTPAVQPYYYTGKIVVSDTAGAINASASEYPPGATYTRDSAGQYTLTLPGVKNAVVVPSLLESASVSRSVRVESQSLSGGTLTVVLQVASIGSTPAAADLVTAADAIHFVVLGHAERV